MYNYLVEENLAYQTNLPIEEVKKRLHTIFREKRASALYDGELKKDKFQMRRIIKYINTFMPEINGALSSNSTGTFLKVNMKFSTTASIFSAIWTIAFIISAFLGNHPSEINVFKLMKLFAFAIPFVSFKIETNKSKKFIENLLEARKIN